jgi:uncharacterized damage-inducible protein DinB
VNISDIQTLYDYNYWANQRILAAAQVNQDQFVAQGGAQLRQPARHDCPRA